MDQNSDLDNWGREIQRDSQRDARYEAELGVTWTWPATVAFLGLLSFLAFLLWLWLG